VYVADAVNGRIQKFDSNGKYLMQINYATNGFWRPRNVMVTRTGDIYVANTGKWNIYHFNSRGAMMGKFIELYGEVFGLATDSIGRIYVADLGGRTIDILAPDLTLLKRRKVPAWRNGEGSWPMLAMDSKLRLYAVAPNEKKIVVYDTVAPNFTCLGEIRNDVNGMPLLDNPLGIAIDSQDNLYITERMKNKVLKIKPVFN